MFNTFSTNEIDLYVCAAEVVGEFRNLQKLNSSKFVPLYTTYVDKGTLVHYLWPKIDALFKQDNDTRNCQAEVEHVDAGGYTVTGVTVKFISEVQARSIVEINSELSKTAK